MINENRNFLSRWLGCQPFPEDIQDMRRRQQGRRTFAQAFDAARPQSSIGGKWYSAQGDLLARLAKRTPVHKPDIESMKRVEHVKSFDWDANSKKAYKLK